MRIKKLHEDTMLPSKGSQEAAGWDLYAYIPEGSVDIAAAGVEKIGTGIAVALDHGTAALILPRSGLATKQGLRPANTPGLIDSDYRGEVIVALYNDSQETRTVKHGDRIGQMLIVPYITSMFALVDSLDDTYRGEGGFGSTGN